MPEQSNPAKTIRPGDHNDITDVPGISVGSAHDDAVKTGVTIVMPQFPWICAGDIRGGGPGTRETDLLDPATLVQTVDALVLSGGSTYGLAAADAVAVRLGAQGRGFTLAPGSGVPVSPIVPAAILYDLANGGDKDWGEHPPYPALARRAFEGLSEGAVKQGRTGAGFGARAGQDHGGLGSASIIDERDGLCIGALMAVNSFGSVRMPGSETFWAWPFEINAEFGGIRPDVGVGAALDLPDDTKLGPIGSGVSPAEPPGRENTTIGIVALSYPLTQAEARRVAIMAQDGLARAIRPVHAPTDGDVLFVLTPPPAADASSANPLTLTRLGTLAADCVARAIAKGVYHAQNSE